MAVLTYDGLRMRVGQTSDETAAAMQAKGGRLAEIFARLRKLRDQHADQIRARFPKIPRRVSEYNLDDLLPEKRLTRGSRAGASSCVIMRTLTQGHFSEPMVELLAANGGVPAGRHWFPRVRIFHVLDVLGEHGRRFRFRAGHPLQRVNRSQARRGALVKELEIPG